MEEDRTVIKKKDRDKSFVFIVALARLFCWRFLPRFFN